MSNLQHIFGPVPSRRLGFSLGVDITPFKTCTLDCVYCQLGRTTNKTIKRESYVASNDVLDELRDVLSRGKRIDYITFSGSGEPTLNSNIGEIIEGIKSITDVHVAVITNGTLLYERAVRDAICHADLIIPSLDAVSQEVFERVNRPHVSLRVNRMIEGLKCLSHEFTGEIWLEMMFVKGYNDGPSEVSRIKTIVSKINHQRIQLNTVVRPPAERLATALSPEELDGIKTMLGGKCNIIEEFRKKEQEIYDTDTRTAILNLTRRRSVTVSDISNSLGIHRNEVIKYLRDLREKKIVRIVMHCGQDYYKLADEPHKEEL